jgi:hypothetical protein
MFAHAAKTAPKRPVPRVSEIKTLPPPTGGVNDRDALIAMPPTDALRIENMICRPYGLEVRRGFSEFARMNTLDKIHSLFSYVPAFMPLVAVSKPVTPQAEPFSHYNNTRDVEKIVPGSKMFAGQANSVFNVTGGGLGPFVAEAGPVGSYWTTTHFTTLGGTFLCCCPIEGGYWYYNGTAWVNVIEHVGGGNPGVNEISGVNPAKFNFVMAWKGRLWFIERDSTRAWYLPPGQLFGIALAYDFGTQFQHGGVLSVIANWTQDAGTGIDDHFVAFSAEGDVSIYKGTDPNSINTFSLVGVWYVGPLPIGNRQVSQYGGDLHILSLAGLTMLSALIRFGSTEHDKVRRTDKINNSLSALLRIGQNTMSWQPTYIPSRSLICIVVPHDVLSRDTMIVQDVNTGGWSSLYDHPAASFLNFNGVLYAGGQRGRIVRALEGLLDDVRIDDLTGTFIGVVVIPAYSMLDKPGLQKMMKQLRVALLGASPPQLFVSALTNYSLRQQTFSPSLPRMVEARWDVALWDADYWSGGYKPIIEWFGIAGVGFSVTPQIEMNTYGGLVLTQYDWLYQPGGPL